ncbi:MAG: OB-fold domain-containing protein [Thermoplasmata archaeon]|nr:MAG: OB-fold domain-containing protein [Thermoplasmata archaeon]
MIKGSKCECGKNVVPQRMLCPVCGGKMTDVEFGNKGTVLTHTTLFAPPMGFEEPIRFALVDLEGKAQLMCTIKGEEEMIIGDEVMVNKEENLYFCEPLK